MISNVCPRRARVTDPGRKGALNPEMTVPLVQASCKGAQRLDNVAHAPNSLQHAASRKGMSWRTHLTGDAWLVASLDVGLDVGPGLGCVVTAGMHRCTHGRYATARVHGCTRVGPSCAHTAGACARGAPGGAGAGTATTLGRRGRAGARGGLRPGRPRRAAPA